MAESQPSGVRLAFRTRATAIELDALPTKRSYVGAPPRPDGVYELLVDGRPTGRTSVDGGNVLTIDMTAGSFEHRSGQPGTARFTGLPAGLKDVEIWLPHDETTDLRTLRTDAPVEPAADRGRRVWLHHGSSISQGSDAAVPTGIWPAVAASLGGVELVNLGLGGSALLDPFTARTMREVPADLISVKLGINLVNADLMRLRAFTPAVHGFLDTIREGHPTAPLLVVSPLLCPIHEETPGPAAPDLGSLGEGRLRFRATGDPAEAASGKLTLGVIRDELAESSRSGRRGMRTCTTSTAATCTATPTSPNCRCPTSSTRTPPHTAASGNASPRRPSPPTAPSPRPEAAETAHAPGLAVPRGYHDALSSAGAHRR